MQKYSNSWKFFQSEVLYLYHQFYHCIGNFKNPEYFLLFTSFVEQIRNKHWIMENYILCTLSTLTVQHNVLFGTRECSIFVFSILWAMGRIPCLRSLVSSQITETASRMLSITTMPWLTAKHTDCYFFLFSFHLFLSCHFRIKWKKSRFPEVCSSEISHLKI
jgi:hypothetical protein